MGTARATRTAINPDILEERWQQAIWRPQPFTDGTVGPKLSGPAQRLTDALETIAARLVDEMSLDEDERGGLGDASMGMLDGPVKQALEAWAEGIERARQDRRATKAAAS